ncbi:MAG: hypothetical protein CM15mV6_0960 [uncultured marine virus]|nr:MAG: hypothetical protein CM15mV6_0960 [uncultured marine virus]
MMLLMSKKRKKSKKMKEFNYDLPYKTLDFTDTETRQLYRIGRGEQGVLLARPYTNDICAHWRFKTPEIAVESANHIFGMYLDYKDEEDFIGMDMCRKFLEMGFTRARRYANHNSGKSMTTMETYVHKKKTMLLVSMQSQQRYLKRLEIL